MVSGLRDPVQDQEGQALDQGQRDPVDQSTLHPDLFVKVKLLKWNFCFMFLNLQEKISGVWQLWGVKIVDIIWLLMFRLYNF